MTHHRFLPLIVLGMCLISACASNNPRPRATAAPAPSAVPTGAADPLAAQLTEQVIATERAFAKTMADRNFKAFITFLSPESVFFSGSTVRRGPAEIAQEWQPYFTAAPAPFSWAPDHVEVLASGKLALSTGPVYQGGKQVGRFDSIWRLDAANTWHIVFDKGEAVCASSP